MAIEITAIPRKELPDVAPTSPRGGVSVEIYYADPNIITEGEVDTAKVTYQIHLDDGSITTDTFDLLERLPDDTDGQTKHLPALNDLKTYILARIDNEAIPQAKK